MGTKVGKPKAHNSALRSLQGALKKRRRKREFSEFKNTSQIATVIVGENASEVESALLKISKIIGGQRDDSVLELSKEKIEAIRRVFGISDLELKAVMGKDGVDNAIINLVIERVALLATQR